jgi:acetyl esterase
MEVKPQLQEVLNKFADLHSLPLENLEPSAARQLPELKEAVCGVIHDHAAKRLMAGYTEPVHSVEHILISGPEERFLARIYKPAGLAPHPVLLYFHGGGWVIGNLNSYDASCRALCNAADCIVVSVAYRQAPEHVYPAAREDAFAAYKWLLKNVASIGGDVHRIAVAGESAGGNLATVVCKMAKDEGLRLPVHQALIYPVTDCDFETPSYIEHANAKPLNRNMMKWFFKHYFDEVPITDPYAFPLLSDNLSGLPPATLITAEIDPLSSEGEAYAEKLREAGVTVYFKCYAGMTHEFFSMGAVVPEAKEAVREVAENLQNSFDDAFDAAELGTRLSDREFQSRYLRESTYF